MYTGDRRSNLYAAACSHSEKDWDWTVMGEQTQPRGKSKTQHQEKKYKGHVANASGNILAEAGGYVHRLREYESGRR
jgi:hypothetical protein